MRIDENRCDISFAQTRIASYDSAEQRNGKRMKREPEQRNICRICRCSNHRAKIKFFTRAAQDDDAQKRPNKMDGCCGQQNTQSNEKQQWTKERYCALTAGCGGEQCAVRGRRIDVGQLICIVDGHLFGRDHLGM